MDGVLFLWSICRILMDAESARSQSATRMEMRVYILPLSFRSIGCQQGICSAYLAGTSGLRRLWQYCTVLVHTMMVWTRGVPSCNAWKSGTQSFLAFTVLVMSCFSVLLAWVGFASIWVCVGRQLCIGSSCSFENIHPLESIL